MPFFRSPALTSLPADSCHGYRLWLFCICAGMLLFFTQVTVLFPVLPLYLVQRWGTQVPVGLVVGAMAVGLLLFRPAIGWLIDRWGRKPVLASGLLIMVGILPLYGGSSSPVYLMGIRVLHGISQAAFATASQTLLADLVPRPRRTQMMGYLAMSNTIGFSLGPLLGSVLFARGGFSAALLAMAVLTLLGFLLLLPLPAVGGSVRAEACSESGTAIGFPWKYIRSFPICNATFFFFVGSFLHGGAVTFLPLFLPNSAVFYSVNALSAVLVRFGLGRWGQRVPQRWLISAALLCSGSALVGLSQLPEFLIFWSILYGCGFGSLFPVLSAIVSLAAPAAARGRVYSFFLAGFDAGMTLGSAGMQPFVQSLPLAVFFALMGGTGCGVSLVAFRQFAKPVDVAKTE